MSKYLLFIFIFTLSCSRLKEPEPIAKVGNAYLYNSDIKGLIKSGLSKEDSLNMVKSIVDQWIKKQLILQRAELNLTNEEKDVSKELDEYRTSLLIYKYELKYIKENLDTTVKSDEVLNYYNLNPNFAFQN